MENDEEVCWEDTPALVGVWGGIAAPASMKRSTCLPNTKMTKKRLVVYGMGLLVLGVLSYIVLIWLNSRTTVPLERLLISTPHFPSQWDTGEGGMPATGINWKIGATYVNPPRVEFYALAETGRMWANNGDRAASPNITQRLFLYNNSGRAALQYWLSSPERAYDDDWPNFTAAGIQEDRYPTVWPYQSPFADQQHVVCAMGSPEHCQLWYYWARYGQYILEIRFFAPNQGINTSLWSQIVAQIDAYVGQQL